MSAIVVSGWSGLEASAVQACSKKKKNREGNSQISCRSERVSHVFEPLYGFTISNNRYPWSRIVVPFQFTSKNSIGACPTLNNRVKTVERIARRHTSGRTM